MKLFQLFLPTYNQSIKSLNSEHHTTVKRFEDRKCVPLTILPLIPKIVGLPIGSLLLQF